MKQGDATFSPVQSHLIEAKAAIDYSSLTEPERVWFTVTRYIFCVRDGGLISYYYNGYAKHVDDLVAALELIGAESARVQVLAINNLYGGRVPKTLNELNAVIDGWADSPVIDRIVNDNGDADLAAAAEAEELLNYYARKQGIEP